MGYKLVSYAKSKYSSCEISMNSRALSRLLQLLVIGLRLPSRLVREKPADSNVKRILVIHQLLLGDAIMATGLLANLRTKYPEADIHVAMPEFLIPLYEKQPYGIVAIPYTPKKITTLVSLFKGAAYDLSYVVGDARYSWAAFAAGSKWVITHGGDFPEYKNWFVDEHIPMPDHIKAMPDLMIDLCSPDLRVNYGEGDWSVVDSDIDMPEKPFVVLHLGASSSLKFWESTNWDALAKKLERAGFSIVITCGPGEEYLVKGFLNSKHQVVSGNYSLLQMWKLIKNAELLVGPDTGISHIAKVTNTPLICIFGPGPYELVGESMFFNTHEARYLSKPIACRDQSVIFKRPVKWLKYCKRNNKQCLDAKCIKQITVDDVYSACRELLSIDKYSDR